MLGYWRVSTRDQNPGDYTVAQIAAELGVSRPTIYRHLARPINSGT